MNWIVTIINLKYQMELSDSSWITIKKKDRKRDPNKQKKYLYVQTRSPDKSDLELTKKEQDLLDTEKDSNPNLKLIGCYCCDCYTISDVIRRSVHPCGTCYCCVGDDPRYDDSDWI